MGLGSTTRLMTLLDVENASATAGVASVNGEPRARKPIDGWWMVLAAGALLLVCAGSCITIALARGNGTTAIRPGGLPATVCVGFATRPHFQAGVVWVSPISSYLPPLATSDYAFCVRVPTKGVPTRPWGGWVLPP